MTAARSICAQCGSFVEITATMDLGAGWLCLRCLETNLAWWEARA